MFRQPPVVRSTNLSQMSTGFRMTATTHFSIVMIHLRWFFFLLMINNRNIFKETELIRVEPPPPKLPNFLRRLPLLKHIRYGCAILVLVLKDLNTLFINSYFYVSSDYTMQQCDENIERITNFQRWMRYKFIFFLFLSWLVGRGALFGCWLFCVFCVFIYQAWFD